MPVVTVNGEKKKVACGPCIRGHRSSKCAHKDRVLIEVRKPGRPLGACPHPPGSCGCERVVINYTVPKERADTRIISGAGSFSAQSKIQKSKPQRSQYNLSNSTVQKVISGDPTALATLANLPAENASGSYSDSSSKPPSTASSSSSTPRIDAVGSSIPTERLIGNSQLQSDSSQDSPWSSVYDRPSTAQTSVSDHSAVETPRKSCCCSGDSDEPSTSSESNAQFPNIENARQSHDNSLGQPGAFEIYQAQDPYSFHQSQNVPGLNTDFGAYELAVGCAGVHSTSLASSIKEHKDCHCGDTCDCFACTTHPNNRTTVDYVRYHNELFMRTQYDQLVRYDGQQRPPYVMPSYPQYAPPQHPTNIHSAFGQPVTHPFTIQHPYAYQNMDWSRSASQPLQSPTSEVEQIHYEAVSQPMAPPNVAAFNSNIHVLQDQQYRAAIHHPIQPETTSSVASEATAATPRTLADIVSAGIEVAESPEDSSTLSPSSFLLQQFTLPDCSNVNGTCLCGEGCNCVGCLTHSGHDRLQNTKVTEVS